MKSVKSDVKYFDYPIYSVITHLDTNDMIADIEKVVEN